MNTKGSSKNLTGILLSTLIGTFVLVSLFAGYTTFLTDNGVSIETETNEFYANLTEQSETLDSFASEVSLKDSVNAIWEGASNVFVVGIGAIGNFFQMIPILNGLLSIVEKAIPGFSALFGIITLIVTVYIAMQIIASKRGTTYKP